MKILKIILAVVLGRVIHALVLAVLPRRPTDPDWAFVIGAGSMLAGFAIVWTLADRLRRQKEAKVAASAQASERKGEESTVR